MRPEFTLLHKRAEKKLPKRLYLLKALKTQHENFLTPMRSRGSAVKSVESGDECREA